MRYDTKSSDNATTKMHEENSNASIMQAASNFLQWVAPRIHIENGAAKLLCFTSKRENVKTHNCMSRC